MTLADLAALAAKVEGFVRPARWTYTDGTESEWDNSPAALLMAVHVCIAERDLSSDIDGRTVVIRRPKSSGIETARDGTPESIARAALVALLRAHGVEVSDEP